MKKVTGEAKSKDFSKLQITDDFMFSAVMRNHRLCKKLLEIILNVKISKIVYREGEKSIDLSAGAKGIRLDVYVKDGKGTVYDIEMQTTVSMHLPKRSRYYQGLIDLAHLEKGSDYKLLKKSYVIFICTDDPFGCKMPVYTFENRCLQRQELALGDETVKVFLNAKGRRDTLNADKELCALLDYISTNVPTSKFTEDLEREVQEVRRNEERRLEYMTLELKLEEEREKACVEEREKCVVRMLRNGYPVEEVSKILEVPTSRVEELAESLD